MKIAVIGHTNSLTTIEELPPRAKLALAEADLILHVGSVGSLTLLKSLHDTFGLMFAVYGKHDPDEVKRYLEARKVVEFANRRLAMVSDAGGTGKGLGLSALKRSALTPSALSEQLLGLFSEVDCVVFGETAEPFNYVHHGIIVLNPGQIVDDSGQGGTMGILDVSHQAITSRLIHL